MFFESFIIRKASVALMAFDILILMEESVDIIIIIKVLTDAAFKQIQWELARAWCSWSIYSTSWHIDYCYWGSQILPIVGNSSLLMVVVAEVLVPCSKWLHCWHYEVWTSFTCVLRWGIGTIPCKDDEMFAHINPSTTTKEGSNRLPAVTWLFLLRFISNPWLAKPYLDSAEIGIQPIISWAIPSIISIWLSIFD